MRARPASRWLLHSQQCPPLGTLGIRGDTPPAAETAVGIVKASWPPRAHDKLAEVVEAGTRSPAASISTRRCRPSSRRPRASPSAPYCALGVLGPDRRISRFITTGLTTSSASGSAASPTGRGILGVLIDEARPLRLHELSEDPRSVGFPPNHPPMHSFLGVPVEGRGERLRQPLPDRGAERRLHGRGRARRAPARRHGRRRDRERAPLPGRHRAGREGPACGRGARRADRGGGSRPARARSHEAMRLVAREACACST